MICSVNPKPSLGEFAELMKKTDILLNADAAKRPSYYASRGGNPLEDDVKAALDESAKDTVFENTIEKISGLKFPDIVAAKFYGVEVKSTKADHWTSTGSSILESSRITDVERIFMTFGKLGGNPIEFISRPYEECLSGIKVTHMPRYSIDMRLGKGETIFDKMGLSYEQLRVMDNPITPVSQYYRSQLKPGESLWWASDTADETVSPTIRLIKNIPIREKRAYTIYACVHFPEVFSGNYDRYAMWLTSQGIVDYHIRDQFSSGGKESMRLASGLLVELPGIYRRLKEGLDSLLYFLSTKDIPPLLDGQQAQGIEMKQRILQWCHEVSQYAERNPWTPVAHNVSYDALTALLEQHINKLGTEYPSEHIVVCQHCGMVYRQKEESQTPGFRLRENDLCPYCQCENGSSMEYEFLNRK